MSKKSHSDGTRPYFNGSDPTSSGIAEFKKELSAYKGAKGSVQFPLDKPIPCSLIAKIVKFRVKENGGKTSAKNQKRLASK